MEVVYPAQAIPLEAHIAILVVSFLVVILAIIFLDIYKTHGKITLRLAPRKSRNNIERGEGEIE